VTPYQRHPRFQELATYLAAKAPNGKLPGRQHVDPIEIPRLLPYLSLVDIVRDAARLRYRFRLIGTDVAAKTATNMTGKWVEEAFPAEAAVAIIRAYDSVVATRTPHHSANVMAVPGREHIRFERIVFPLARDGETIDMLIGVYAFADP
jgi:hypothetical protein